MKCSLADAIEKLYAAFADVPKPKLIEGCPCCIDSKNIDTLLSKPLREIPADELYSYAFSLFLTVGRESDFKYFLPRIYDVLTTDSNFDLDPEIALRKLSYVQWQEWRQDKKLAIANFIESAFTSFVLRSQDNDFVSFHNDADVWLCAIAHTGIAIEPLLKRIEQHPQALVDLYEQNSKALIKGKLSNGFWHDVPNTCQTVIDWFQSDRVRKSIDRQYSILYDS